MLARLSMSGVNLSHLVFTTYIQVNTLCIQSERLNSNKSIRRREGAYRNLSGGLVRNPLNKSRGGEDGKCADKIWRGWGGEVNPSTTFTTIIIYHHPPPPLPSFIIATILLFFIIIYFYHFFIIPYYHQLPSFHHNRTSLPP